MSDPPDDSRPRFLRELRPLPTPRQYVGPVVPPGQANGYATSAFKAECVAVASALIGQRNDTLNVAAFNLSQLIASGHLRHEDVWNGLYDAGLAAGLTEKETGATLASGFRAGLGKPREVPERPDKAPTDPLTVPEDSPGDLGPGPEGTEGEDRPLIVYPVPLNWQDLYESEEPEEEWIVKPILPARRLVALYSKAKAGKSLLMLEVAVGVSRGVATLGYTPDRPRRVLYVDLENDPRGDVVTRCQRMGHKWADLDNLIYLSFPDLPMLDTAMGAAVLLDWVDHFDCEVVVIDTVSRVVAGEENDNNTWLAFYRHTGKQLKANGTTCIRLDHTGKDAAKGMRGGSAKYSDVDLVWSLAASEDGTRIQLECTAQRLPVRERLITLARSSEPVLHHNVVGDGHYVAWKAEQAEYVAALDREFGPEATTSVRQAGQWLRPHGYKIGQSDLSDLVRDRNDAISATRALSFGVTEDES